MKKLIYLVAIIFFAGPAFAQNELLDKALDKAIKQGVEIESLKKLLQANSDTLQQLIEKNNRLQDTIKKLKTDLASLDGFRKGKNKMDSLLKQKTDSISLLTISLAEAKKSLTAEKQNGDQKARDESDKAKKEILTSIADRYKNKSFDDLLKSSTRQSVQADLPFVENSKEIKQMLIDAEKYFIIEDLVYIKLDPAKIESNRNLLGQIKYESTMLTDLKKILGKYQTFNNGLKETIDRVLALDNAEKVAGMSKEIQKKKLNKVLAEVSYYLFTYDFKFSDYPYLGNILLELIKRKQENSDADISDLLKQL